MVESPTVAVPPVSSSFAQSSYLGSLTDLIVNVIAYGVTERALSGISSAATLLNTIAEGSAGGSADAMSVEARTAARQALLALTAQAVSNSSALTARTVALASGAVELLVAWPEELTSVSQLSAVGTLNAVMSAVAQKSLPVADTTAGSILSAASGVATSVLSSVGSGGGGGGDASRLAASVISGIASVVDSLPDALAAGLSVGNASKTFRTATIQASRPPALPQPVVCCVMFSACCHLMPSACGKPAAFSSPPVPRQMSASVESRQSLARLTAEPLSVKGSPSRVDPMPQALLETLWESPSAAIRSTFLTTSFDPHAASATGLGADWSRVSTRLAFADGQYGSEIPVENLTTPVTFR